MPEKPDQTPNETAFHDPAELAAARAAAVAEDTGKTQELRPLRVTTPAESVGGPSHRTDERHAR